MTRILGMADLHVGATHLTSLEEQAEALGQVVELARIQHVDAVVVAGDSAHYAHPTTAVVEILGQFVHALELLNVDVVFVEGNHDRGLPGIAQHFRGRVHAVTTPRIVSLPGVDIAALPYLPDSFARAAAGAVRTKEEIAHQLTVAAADIVAGFLAQRRPGIPMVFAGHGTVAGSETSTGFNLGFLPGTAWLLQPEQLAQFAAAIVGHIHKSARRDTIVIPGSLLPLDFSETEPKGVWLVDVGPNPAPWMWPQFRAIVTPRVETYELAGREGIETFLAHTPALPNARARIRVACDEATAREYPPSRISAEAYAAGASLVQVELDIARADRRRDAEMTDELDPAAAIARYLAGREDLDQAGREDLDQLLTPRVESLAGVTIANVASSGPRLGGDLAIVELSAQDFIGIRDASLVLDGEIYAITGPVGAGKSSLGSDVPRFALFGESRAGTKDRDRLIRQGAETAAAAATLRGTDGRVYRVVRKLHRGARGAVASTLDVLERNGEEWRPLSNGKVADGQAVIDRILGGLSDETLVTANLILQRESDRYTRARAEDRRRVLAEAAGLAVFDRLADDARELQRQAEKQLGELHAAAAPLEARAAEVHGVEAFLVNARQEADHRAHVELADARERLAPARAAYEAAQRAEHEIDAAKDRIRLLAADVAVLANDIADLEPKITKARALLDKRHDVEIAAAELVTVRARIVTLEADQVAEAEATARVHAAELALTALERRLAEMVAARKARARELDLQIGEVARQERRLADAQCPVIDQIRADKVPACTFLTDAQRDVKGFDALERELAKVSEATEEELALATRIEHFDTGTAPDGRATREALTNARARARDLEIRAGWAERLADAERYVAAETKVLEGLRARHATKTAELAAARRTHDALRTGPSVLTAADALTRAEQLVARIEADALQLAREIARSEGRLEELRAAAAEHERLVAQIRDVAVDVAAAKELVTAWRACRVMVLETSVIPAVEETANEILSRFPYELQLRFATQRDRKSGDGQAETLDIEVLGGKGQIYELCSGGQQTVIDFALHVAIALVVSRRAGSRLRYLYVDEPAFLDAPGYEAFASVIRFIHETFHLTVLVASHVRDLVDALGAREFAVEPGPDGSRLREEALA